MSDRILLMGLVGFAGGISCRSLFFWPWQFLLLILLFAASLSVLYVSRRAPLYLLVLALCIGAAIGFGRVMLAPAAPSAELAAKAGSTVAIEGVVAQEPDVREQSQRIVLRLESGDRVLAVAPLHPEVSIGDTVEAAGTLERPEPFATDEGRTFRYDQFLAKDGIFLVLDRASLRVIGSDLAPQDYVLRALLSLKHGFQNGLSSALPEPHASLASGLITGGKQGLGERLLDAFIISGLVHIVVLSGYNVMIVAEAVLRALSSLSRRAAAVAAGMVIFLFVLVAGAGAASVRAGLMAGLALTARATGRTYAVLRALAAAGTVMLLINPLLLAYDPGFQLSFLATLGLILLAPRIARSLGFIRSEFWRELLAATIAAQVAVLPLLLYQTGLFSLVSIPANLFVLPVVPLAMLFAAIAGAVGFIAAPFAPLLGLPALMLLSYIVSVAETAASLPLSSVTVPQFPFVFVVLAYLALLVWIRNTPVAHERATGVFGAKA